ncbi:hypothetical protein LMG28138_02831 [Pararobbsia alpina]|uniref:Uncharacterized protein n=1 Tax=Pararobbsia alpina TaxID=621374 RepID=A0A6S7B6S8_9BURK|nr:hypothetical protein LMG28138_02831 [Pararobbsia alpina]
MIRANHPKKEVEHALRYAEANNWRIAVGGAHAWGRSIVPTRTMIAAVGSFASLACGVPQRILAITPAP